MKVSSPNLRMQNVDFQKQGEMKAKCYLYQYELTSALSGCAAV